MTTTGTPRPPTSHLVGEARARAFGNAKWNVYPPDVISLGIAEMDVEVDPVVSDGLHAFVTQGGLGYSTEADARALAVAASEMFDRRYRWKVEPGAVHPIGDALQGIAGAIEVFSPDGSGVVLLTPCYAPFFDVVRYVRRPVVTVPLASSDGRYELDLDAIDVALRGGPRTVVLCHPANPTGQSYTTDELRSLTEIVERNGARVVSDELHAPLTFAPAVHHPYAGTSDVAARHSVTVTSASKGWNLAGLKCAQLITSTETDRQRWLAASPMIHHGASRIGIVANTLAYESRTAWLDEVTEQLRGASDALADALAREIPQITYRRPEATYLAWLDCSDLELAEEPATFFLREALVGLNPGSSFGPGGEGFARLNCGTHPDVVRAAVNRMADALARR